MSTTPLPPTGDAGQNESTAQSFISELADLVTSLTATSVLTTAMAHAVVEAARLYGMDETTILLCQERGKRRAVRDLARRGMLPKGDPGSFEAVRNQIIDALAP